MTQIAAALLTWDAVEARSDLALFGVPLARKTYHSTSREFIYEQTSTRTELRNSRNLCRYFLTLRPQNRKGRTTIDFRRTPLAHSQRSFRGYLGNGISYFRVCVRFSVATSLSWPHHGFDKFDGTPTRFSRYGRSFPKLHCPSSYLSDSCSGGCRAALTVPGDFPKHIDFPRSVCHNKPLAGLRFHTAINNASLTSLVRLCAAIDQPTTCRENRSITTAKYSQPSWVRIVVMSPT